MPNCSTTLQLACDLETYAAACKDEWVHASQTSQLLEDAVLRLNRHYGICNRHSVAVVEMFNNAKQHRHDDTVCIDFFNSVARRLRNISAVGG